MTAKWLARHAYLAGAHRRPLRVKPGNSDGRSGFGRGRLPKAYRCLIPGIFIGFKVDDAVHRIRELLAAQKK
jgi:hypothetical protein